MSGTWATKLQKALHCLRKRLRRPRFMPGNMNENGAVIPFQFMEDNLPRARRNFLYENVGRGRNKSEI